MASGHSQGIREQLSGLPQGQGCPALPGKGSLALREQGPDLEHISCGFPQTPLPFEVEASQGPVTAPGG